MPPQVPEPIGAGSAIPLPAGDWVAVARYEKWKKGLDPSKSERSGIGVLQRWGGKGPLTDGAGCLKGEDLKGKTPARSGAGNRIPYRAGGGDKNPREEMKGGVLVPHNGRGGGRASH